MWTKKRRKKNEHFRVRDPSMDTIQLKIYELIVAISAKIQCYDSVSMQYNEWEHTKRICFLIDRYRSKVHSMIVPQISSDFRPDYSSYFIQHLTGLSCIERTKAPRFHSVCSCFSADELKRTLSFFDHFLSFQKKKQKTDINSKMCLMYYEEIKS